MELSVSSVVTHKGEEPVISGDKGICNVFFGHCNLQCLYCQNHQISRNVNHFDHKDLDLIKVTQQIVRRLKTGITHLGFVSPSHVPLQMKMIINSVRAEQFDPVIVYNSNGYDGLQTLKTLEPDIDIYLPDFKYADNELSLQYSGAGDYVENVVKSISEMIAQKGELKLNGYGLASNGVIIRHLVLPGHIQNSIDVLRIIAKEFGTSIHLSLMAQYYPMQAIKEYPNMSRILNPIEYDQVLEELEKLGFENGWVQELESNSNYLPDFEKEEPFERN